MKNLRLTLFLAAAAAAQRLGPLPAATNIAVNNPGELGLVSPQGRSSHVTTTPHARTLLPSAAGALARPHQYPTSYLLYNHPVPHYGAGVLPSAVSPSSLVLPQHYHFVPSYAHLIANNPYQMVGNAVSRNDSPGKQLAFNDLYHQGYIPPEFLPQYNQNFAQPYTQRLEERKKQYLSVEHDSNNRKRLKHPTAPQPHSQPAPVRIESLETYYEPDIDSVNLEHRPTARPSLYAHSYNQTGQHHSHNSQRGNFIFESPTRRTFTDTTDDFSYRPSFKSTMKPTNNEELPRYDVQGKTQDSNHERWHSSLKHDFGQKIEPKENPWHVDTRNLLSTKPAPASPLYSLSFLTPEDTATQVPSNKGNNLLTAKDSLTSEHFRYSKLHEDFVPQPNLAKHLPPYYLPYSPLTDDYRPTHDIYFEQTRSRGASLEHYDLRHRYSPNNYVADGHTYTINTEPLTNIYDIHSPTYKDRVEPPYRPKPIHYHVDSIDQKQPKEAWNSFPYHRETLSIQEQLDSFHRDETLSEYNPPHHNLHINELIFHEDIVPHVRFSEHEIRGATYTSTTESPVLQAVSPNFKEKAEFYSTTPYPMKATTREYLKAWPITPPPSFFPDRSRHTTAPPSPSAITQSHESYDTQDASGGRKIIESSPNFQEQAFKAHKQMNEPKLRPYVPSQQSARQRQEEKAKTHEFVVGIPPIPPNLPLVYHPQILENNSKPSHHNKPKVSDQWTPMKQLHGYTKTYFRPPCNEHSTSQQGYEQKDDAAKKIHRTTIKPSGVYFSPYASLAPPVTPHSLRLGKTNLHNHEVSPDDHAVPQVAFVPIPMKPYSKYVPMTPRDRYPSHEPQNMKSKDHKESHHTRAYIPPYHQPISGTYSHSRREEQPRLPYLPRRSRLRRRPLWFGLARQTQLENQRSFSNSKLSVPLPADYPTLRRNGVQDTELDSTNDRTENESTKNGELRTEYEGEDKYQLNEDDTLAQESNEFAIFDTLSRDGLQINSTSPRSAAEKKIYHLRQHQIILQNTKLRPPLEEENSRRESIGQSDTEGPKRRRLGDSIKRRKARNRRRGRKKKTTDASPDANDAHSTESDAKMRIKSRPKVARGERLRRRTTQQPARLEDTATATTTLSDGLSLQHIYEPFLKQLKEWDAKHG